MHVSMPFGYLTLLVFTRLSFTRISPLTLRFAHRPLSLLFSPLYSLASCALYLKHAGGRFAPWRVLAIAHPLSLSPPAPPCWLAFAAPRYPTQFFDLRLVWFALLTRVLRGRIGGLALARFLSSGRFLDLICARTRKSCVETCVKTDVCETCVKSCARTRHITANTSAAQTAQNSVAHKARAGSCIMRWHAPLMRHTRFEVTP